MMAQVKNRRSKSSVASKKTKNNKKVEEACSFGLPNVHEGERLISAVLGAGLILRNLRRRSWINSSTLMGVSLLYRALSGHCALYQALEMNTRTAFDTARKYGGLKASA